MQSKHNAAAPIQLAVSGAEGNVGDNICVDVLATEFNKVSSASFSISFSDAALDMTEIRNVGFSEGTFTSTLCTPITGDEVPVLTGFVAWTADAGESLSLGPIATLVEVCADIIDDMPDEVIISITDEKRDIEFFDGEGLPIEFATGSGSVCVRHGSCGREMDSHLRLQGDVCARFQAFEGSLMPDSVVS